MASAIMGANCANGSGSALDWSHPQWSTFQIPIAAIICASVHIDGLRIFFVQHTEDRN